MATEHPPAEIWRGEPSGPRLAGLLRGVAASLDVEVQIDVQEYMPGAYLVNDDRPGDGPTFVVVDWHDGVQILDPGDTEATLQQALACFAARAHGMTARDADEAVFPRRPSLWRRWRARPDSG